MPQWGGQSKLVYIDKMLEKGGQRVRNLQLAYNQLKMDLI